MLDQQRWLRGLMTSMIRYSLVMATIVGLSGCTSPIWKLVKPQMEKSHDAERIDLHRQETAFYRNKSPRDGRPKVCLALSGGGLRSAAYSLGVMRALHETRILGKVDVISAVSGGSYALG
jgi:Patatin-like phospholipase